MFWFGLVILILASLLAIFIFIGECIEFNGEILAIAIILLTPMFIFGSLMVKHGRTSDKTNNEKVEMIETDKIESNLLTAQFFEEEGIHGVLGLYELGGGLRYDLANQEIFIEYEKDFELERVIIFDEIKTIDQLQEFYKLRGEDRDFSKYLNSN